MNNDNPNPLQNSIDALQSAQRKAQVYLENISARAVAPSTSDLSNLAMLDIELPEHPNEANESIELLDKYGSPATVATVGGRFYGLVVGGALPATVGTRVLAAAWDQLATSQATSPVSMQIERTATKWLQQLFGLPSSCSVGFVSGTTMGNFICLAAARHRHLAQQGWDVEKQGLYGAPPLHIVASEEIHITVAKVLAMLGLGSDNVERVATDDNGAILLEAMPDLKPESIVITQAGNVNSGAIDPISEIADLAQKVGAWVHVDGAFGLWAATSEKTKHKLKGFEKADSWVTDGHKWLNTPYDCGIAFCQHPKSLHNAMSTVAPYLSKGFDMAPKDMVPEFSRSARAMDVWAALHSLGKSGVSGLVDRCCQHARFAALELEKLGFEILNQVALNQVVVSHPIHESRLAELTDRVCTSGEAWFGVTHWKQRDGFRLSFSSWVTTPDDVIRLINAIKSTATDMGICEKSQTLK